MSRAAVTKSRADKTKGGTSAPTPAVLHEIVPGKYNDQDWSGMLERDDGDDFILEIVEDICNGAISIIYDKYIKRQLLPFTILQAKDAILQIIEWQFLTHDDGEPDVETDETWIGDEEPIPAVADCWAQGLVPRKFVAGMTPRGTPEPIYEEPDEEQDEQSPEPTPVPETEVETQAEENKDQVETQAEEDEEEGKTGRVETPPAPETQQEPLKKPEPPKEQPKKKRKKFRPYGGRLKSAGLGGLTESLEQTESRILAEESQSNVVEESTDGANLQNMPASCHSILKVQAGRPPGNKDVLYDDQGNVVSVVKLDPNRLPSHCVRTTFTVVDPAAEAAQARLEAMRTGRFIPTEKTKKTNQFMSVICTAVADSKSSKESKVKEAKIETVKALPAPLIESMEVAPGVVVREGNRVKRGPRQFTQTKETETTASLRPLFPHTPSPAHAARDILDCGTPILRMIRESPNPLPPIGQT